MSNPHPLPNPTGRRGKGRPFDPAQVRGRVHMEQDGRPLCRNRGGNPRTTLLWVRVTCRHCRKRSDRNGPC